MCCQFEVAQAGIDLVDRSLGRGHMAQRVQRHEIVNRAIVADRIDADPRLLQLAGVGLPFVAQRIVLRGDDERRRQPLELAGAGAKR